MKKSLAILLVSLVAIGSYLPALRNGFVWDDTALILRDPLIRSWRLIPEGFNHFLFVDATASDFYRPLQRLSYTLEYCAFGFSPVAYHTSNILLHAAAAIALLFLAEEFLLSFALGESRRRWIALGATLIWAIHPAHSSAVIYISGRADPLAALFGFWGCYFLLRSARATRRSFALTIAGAVALALSILSKESGAIFPLLLLVLFGLRANWTALRRTAAATAFVATVYFSLRLAAEHFPTPALRAPTPWAVRPINMARAVAEYATVLVFPVNLHMERRIEVQRADSMLPNMEPFGRLELQTLAGLSLIGLVAWWAIRARKREPAVFTLLILAAVSYLPVSGLISLNASVAEHWLYVPSAFLFLAGAVTLTSLFAERAARITLRNAAAVGLAMWTLFLGVRTAVRTFDWKDQRTFLEQTIAAGGPSARMLINLGGLELSEGKLEAARAHLMGALHLEPGHPFALVNLAAVALKQKDFPFAREMALRATNLSAVEAQGHELLAVIEHHESGTTNLRRLHLATRTGPPNWAIEKRYVQSMDESGATVAAIGELQRCLQTQWYRADSWKLLGQLMDKIGRSGHAAVARHQANNYDVHLSPAGG